MSYEGELEMYKDVDGEIRLRCVMSLVLYMICDWNIFVVLCVMSDMICARLV